MADGVVTVDGLADALLRHLSQFFPDMFFMGMDAGDSVVAEFKTSFKERIDQSVSTDIVYYIQKLHAIGTENPPEYPRTRPGALLEIDFNAISGIEYLDLVAYNNDDYYQNHLQNIYQYNYQHGGGSNGGLYRDDGSQSVAAMNKPKYLGNFKWQV